MDLLIAGALQTGVQRQRASNQKRITRVGKYLDDEGTLPIGACAFVPPIDQPRDIHRWPENGRSRNSAAVAQAEVRVPLMVRLARGDVSEMPAQELTCILQALHNDAGLTPRRGEVVTRLLPTAGQVVLRFSQYTKYPARASLMSRTCNPATYYQKLVRFCE